MFYFCLHQTFNAIKKYFNIFVPTKPYLQKFSEKRYGEHIHLDCMSNLLAVIAFTLLQKKKLNLYYSKEKQRRTMEEMTGRIHFLAPRYFWYRHGHNIPNEAAIQISRVLQADFEERMHLFVANHINPDSRYSGYTEAIEKFADFYGIEIDKDITLDGLKKMNYRYRKNLEKKLTTLSLPEEQNILLLF